ncbi:MAG: hypothetical protein ACRDQX_01905 [Pseudonocardiaceae bacterium]
MSVVIEGWMVLPDRPDARRVVADWPSGVRCVVAHASGNPFLLGSLAQHELTLAMVGSLRVAVIGVCPVTATRLSELVARVRTVAELDAVAGVLPGCWHLVASLDGVVRVQGSFSGLRRVLAMACERVRAEPPRLGGSAGRPGHEKSLPRRLCVASSLLARHHAPYNQRRVSGRW